MRIIGLISQILIAAGIFNVWLLRFNKSTDYRGGSAGSMKEEFAAYGLPQWFMWLIGGLKMALAIALLIGIWVPSLVRPAALGMAALMVGAIGMHIKVSDPVKKAIPAVLMLVLSILAYTCHV